MAIDYSEGRFTAYGFGDDAPKVGWIEDGYMCSEVGTWQFRIDGDEIYGVNGDFVGSIDDGVATRAGSGQFLFRLERD